VRDWTISHGTETSKKVNEDIGFEGSQESMLPICVEE
jgi:hypothetical protein